MPIPLAMLLGRRRTGTLRTVPRFGCSFSDGSVGSVGSVGSRRFCGIRHILVYVSIIVDGWRVVKGGEENSFYYFLRGGGRT